MKSGPGVGGPRLKRISTMLSGLFPSFHWVVFVGGFCQCGRKMAAAPPGVTPGLQAGRRGKGRPVYSFEKVSWNLHLYLSGRNWVAWLSLTGRSSARWDQLASHLRHTNFLGTMILGNQNCVLCYLTLKCGCLDKSGIWLLGQRNLVFGFLGQREVPAVNPFDFPGQRLHRVLSQPWDFSLSSMSLVTCGFHLSDPKFPWL